MQKMHFAWLTVCLALFSSCTQVANNSSNIPKGDGQGFTGIITFDNAEARCESTRLDFARHRIACRVVYRIPENTKSLIDYSAAGSSRQVAYGVSFNWSLATTSGVNLASISTCDVSGDTLNYTCEVDTTGLQASFALDVLLSVFGQEQNLRKSVATPINIPPPTAAPPAPPASGDPHYSNVALLLKMNGAPSDPIVDAKGRHAVTSYGAQVSATPSKFGDGACFFSGTSFPSLWGGDDYLEVASSTDFDFGAQDFTVEMYLFFRVVGPYNRIISRWDNPARNWMLSYEHNKWFFYYSFNGSSETSISADYSPQANQWYHLAISRSAGEIRLFVDGVKIASQSISGSLAGSTQKVLIGKINNNEDPQFIGSMNYLRITKGVGRYTNDFTPPTSTGF